MLKQIDLASIAEEIESPYRPIPLATLEGLEVSLFISTRAKSWRRQSPHEQALFVLEGVITIDGPAGKVVVNEGDVAAIGADVGHGLYSGMRSSVVLIEERPADGSSNGHRTLPDGAGGGIERVGAAVQARSEAPFEWRSCGNAGRFAVSATRLVGSAAGYVSPSGSLVLLVFRGMLDYESAGKGGSMVGSQMLTVPADTQISFHSEHGATVLAAAREGAALPVKEAHPEASNGTSEDPPSA